MGINRHANGPASGGAKVATLGILGHPSCKCQGTGLSAQILRVHLFLGSVFQSGRVASVSKGPFPSLPSRQQLFELDARLPCSFDPVDREYLPSRTWNRLTPEECHLHALTLWRYLIIKALVYDYGRCPAISCRTKEWSDRHAAYLSPLQYCL